MTTARVDLPDMCAVGIMRGAELSLLADRRDPTVVMPQSGYHAGCSA